MTTFKGGPVAGKTLMLRRAPIFLRVVTKGDEVDALNEPGDSPAPAESLFAYILTGVPGSVHIRASKGGGYYKIAEYRFIPEQPDDATMRNEARWVEWVEAHAELAKPIEEEAEELRRKYQSPQP